MKSSELKIRVYVVDDDAVLLSAIVQAFELENFDVTPISEAKRLLAEIDEHFAAVIVTDVRMPKMDGITFFKAIKKIDPEIPVIFLTGHADAPMVLSTLHEGAFDFFSKPVDTEHLLATTRRAIDTRRLVLENRELKARAKKVLAGSELIGESPIMEQLRSTIHQIAKSEVDVLLEGETSTGKNLVAHMLHQLSERASNNFVAVNCSALPERMAESELFGAIQNLKSNDRSGGVGKIEQSHKGTLFLDEIDSLPLNIQGQLVPVLESRKMLGMSVTGGKKLSLRVIASTSKDLLMAVEQGEFRADLYYLLSTVRLRLPPLRNRRDDIPLLFAHFVSLATQKFSKKIPKMNLVTQQRLIEYEWPGNVRELKNYADSIVLGIEDQNVINIVEQLTLPDRVEKFEANTIRSALEQSSGDVRSTIKQLGIPRKTFYDKVTRHKININKYRKQVD
jgi:two-component system C4-dicarboxylate transport response regulator DctD